MKTKKVILFIVEGISDKTSLALILTKLIKTEHISFHIVDGDILSDSYTTLSNCITKVNQEINRFLGSYRLKRTDVLKVVHLIDTDGAFVGEEFIQEENIKGFIYSSEFIKAKNIETVLRRNYKKSSILNKLSSCPEIARIPFRMFYFSCNLEHVLHNECNMDDDKKMEVASTFEEAFVGREEEFLEFIRNDEFAVPGDFKESWEFIKRNNHSLERYCNFHLFFQ